MLQNNTYWPAGNALTVSDPDRLGLRSSTSPNLSASGIASSSTDPSDAVGSAASALTTTSSCSSLPMFLTWNRTVPLATETGFGFILNSRSLTFTVVVFCALDGDAPADTGIPTNAATNTEPATPRSTCIPAIRASSRPRGIGPKDPWRHACAAPEPDLT